MQSMAKFAMQYQWNETNVNSHYKYKEQVKLNLEI